MVKPKVLIIEDIEELHYAYGNRLDTKVQFFSALTIEQARQVFYEHHDWAAIAVDACVPGDTPNTVELVKELRSKFSGPIIATSGDPSFNYMLVEAGCNYFCGKPQLPALLGMILELGLR